ncbi:conserved Plasmodium protein, unknown function [Plasmodium relictum]|uniref:Uncharacterized protein n=1 Tax=Plasmodium relictum TaxID=85471 RepID=A0A1J1HBX1_PLARL|nr:conserved Plasmodium protein, unknown function [Plasmodium relictum]CRH02799.1 conserved Plasmodium protein, unknown function [Plasmodium relictum]
MKIIEELNITFLNCCKNVEKKKIKNIKSILNKNNKKKEKELEKLFEFLSNLLNKDLEKDVLKIKILSLKEEEKERLFNNLRRIFRTFVLFKNENEYIEMLCDFLFYLFKYMRKLNVKKTYKLIRKVTKEGKEDTDNFIEKNKTKEDKKVEKLHDEKNIKHIKDTGENIEKEKNNDNNMIDKRNNETIIDSCLNRYNKLIFNFLLNSNILIYLEKLKKEDSKNLLCDEHYFFMKLTKTMFNKKYILELSNSICFIILKYPKFPLFIDSLFNLFFFVRNKLIIFFIKNIYKKISDIIILKNNEINKKFTIKKYYNLIFCVYFLYKIKIIIYLYLNSDKCNILNDYIEHKTIVDFYIKIMRDYKNSIYYCFYTINNRKNNKKNSQNLCLVVIYLINLIYTSHNDILKIFDNNTNKCVYFKKYKDIFYQYHKMLDNLFKNNQYNSFIQTKMKSVFLNNISTKNNNNSINKKKSILNKNFDPNKTFNKNKILSNNDHKFYDPSKYIKNYLLNKIIDEDDYSFCFIISFIYTLIYRSIRLYDYRPLLSEAIFYKKLYFDEIYSANHEVLNNQNITSKIQPFDYSKILYNNFFLNLVKNNFYFFINIDKNILNYFFINEFQKFMMNKNLNYKNLYYILGYKINDKYHEINILLLFQKIILRNILKYRLRIEEDLRNDQNEKDDDIKEKEYSKNNITYFFNKDYKKLKMLNINEFNISNKEIYDLIKKKSENAFIVLNNISFLDLNNSIKNFFFDKNIINLLLYQLTKEGFTVLKFLHASKSRKKEEINIYIKNLNFLVIILKSISNLINSFLSIIRIVESKKKCMLIYNDNKHFIFSDDYYEKIKSKKKNTHKEKIVSIYFEENFNKKCMKKKYFQIMNKFIKLYIVTIKEKYIKQKVFCDNEFIEIGKVIFFVFDFMIFYISNSININEKNHINILKDLKKFYYNLFSDINNIYELIKNNQKFQKEVKNNLISFSKNYLFIYQKLNSKIDKNYFTFFVNCNYLEIDKKEDNKISKQIYDKLKNLTIEEIFNSKISDNEITEDDNKIKRDDTIINDEVGDNDEDIIISNSLLLDLLADDNSKKKEKKNDLQKKKTRSNLFYDVTYLLKHLKINIKNESAESIIKSLYYMLYSLIIISKKVKLISKKIESIEEEKEKEEEEEEKKKKEEEEKKKKEEEDKSEVENVNENKSKNEKSTTSIYIEDLTNLGKSLKHILLSFKVKNIKIKDSNKLDNIINKYLFKIIMIIIKEKKNIDIIKISIKCLEYYNIIENKINSKNNNVINYLFEFLKIIFFVPYLKVYYSKYLNLFFKSAFVRYMNVNELFNQVYKKYFHQIISKFYADFNISDYIYNKVKIKNIDIVVKKKFIKKIINSIRESNKNEYETVKETYNNYLNNIKNDNTSLNSFNFNDLFHIIQNICIFFNKKLTDNNAYVFNKKVSLNLLGILKRISSILYMKDENLVIFKDELIKNLVEVHKFHKLLDDELSNQKIHININSFNKKLVAILESLKPFEFLFEQYSINGLNGNNIIKYKKKSNKRSSEKSIQIKKKIKI